MIKIGVITVSDSCYQGKRKDESGSFIKKKAEEIGWEVICYKVVPDEKEMIKKAILEFRDKGADIVFTTGGTGLSKRDITPEATREVIEKEIPGIGEIMRIETFKETKYSVLSRGIAGVSKDTLIINLPGSLKGVTQSLSVILPILEHCIDMVKGKGHEEN